MSKQSNIDLQNSLDFHFSWRWLLPVKKNDVLAFDGLSAEEVLWWEQQFPANSAETRPNGLLISLDNFADDTISDLSLESPQWLCAWGDGAAVYRLANSLQGFSVIRFYALLPSSFPRVVIPLSSPAAAMAGLRLHSPGRLFGRLAVRVVMVMARIGYFGLLQKRLLVVACRERDSSPRGANILSGIVRQKTDFALYLGAAERNRKTVILPVPLLKGLERSIIKTANNPVACTALRNEAAALLRMGVTDLRRNVPRLQNVSDHQHEMSIVQEYRSRIFTLERNKRRAVQDFLSKLGHVDVRCTTLSAVYPVFPKSARPEICNLINWLKSLPPDTSCRLHRSHGDFAPWNCAWTRQGLFVYDWEASRASALALSDAFYYVIAPLRLIKQDAQAENSLSAIKSFVLPILRPLKIEVDDVPMYLAIWLIEQPEHVLHIKIAAALLEKLK